MKIQKRTVTPPDEKPTQLWRGWVTYAWWKDDLKCWYVSQRSGDYKPATHALWLTLEDASPSGAKHLRPGRGAEILKSGCEDEFAQVWRHSIVGKLVSTKTPGVELYNMRPLGIAKARNSLPALWYDLNNARTIGFSLNRVVLGTDNDRPVVFLPKDGA